MTWDWDLAKCLWLKWANSWHITDANSVSKSVLRNIPLLIPIIPPGAANALIDSSSITTNSYLLSLTSLVSEIL